MIQYLRFQMADEMLQTELWGNREWRSLFLRVPFESPHLHQPSLSEAELRLGKPQALFRNFHFRQPWRSAKSM